MPGGKGGSCGGSFNLSFLLSHGQPLTINYTIQWVMFDVPYIPACQGCHSQGPSKGVRVKVTGGSGVSRFRIPFRNLFSA